MPETVYLCEQNPCQIEHIHCLGKLQLHDLTIINPISIHGKRIYHISAITYIVLKLIEEENSCGYCG